jgi:heptosyltransferase I
LRSVVTTGPKEERLAAEVHAHSRSGKTITVRPTLKGFYELAKRADLYVGGDTGPTHLAIAAGAPIVGIFGPTEWWRNGSLDPDDVCVARFDIDCRVDCHRRTCSKWICMDIRPEVVLDAVRTRLARKMQREVVPAVG